MKSIFVVVGMVLLLSMAFAAETPGIHEAGTGIDNPELKAETQGSGQGEGEPMLTGVGEGEKVRLQEGAHIGANGEQMMIQAEANNQMRLEVGGKVAKSSMGINQEIVDGQTKLSTKLSNGRDAEIKVMPDSASETALARLRLKNCVEADGCSIELKEVGEGEGAKLAYEVKTQRQSRFLGIFGAEMDVEVQVDAETGEVLDVKKPWWAILASEPAEE